MQPSRPHITPIMFRIDPAIFARFPTVQIGVVVARGIDNSGHSDEIIAALRAEEARVTRALAGTAPADHPHIAPWRDAYRAFGANPKKYPSSIENLVSRVMRGSPLRHINKLVDIYNTISLRYIIPVGGEDLDTIRGDILLTIATDAEPAITLLGEDEPRSLQPGEVIYKDSIGAICRRWNWKEADRTKLTEQTTNAILVIEALPPVGSQLLGDATNDLARTVQHWCGGQTRTAILNASSPSMDLIA